MRIKKGDFIRIISGNHKGVEGQIVRIDHSKAQIFIEELKMKKHVKPTENDSKGKITEILHPIHVSNVMALDPKKKVLTRIGYKFDSNNQKVRFAKKTGQNYAL